MRRRCMGCGSRRSRGGDDGSGGRARDAGSVAVSGGGRSWRRTAPLSGLSRTHPRARSWTWRRCSRWQPAEHARGGGSQGAARRAGGRAGVGAAEEPARPRSRSPPSCSRCPCEARRRPDPLVAGGAVPGPGHGLPVCRGRASTRPPPASRSTCCGPPRGWSWSWTGWADTRSVRRPHATATRRTAAATRRVRGAAVPARGRGGPAE